MYNDSKDDAERSTVIILDVENAEIRTLGLEIGEVGGNSSKTYHTGTRFGNRIVLGNVHTHQQEVFWMADGFSDLASIIRIFNIEILYNTMSYLQNVRAGFLR